VPLLTAPLVRAAVVAAAAALALTACSSSGLSFTGGSGATASSAPYVAPKLKVTKPAPWNLPLSVKVTKGQLTTVTVTDATTHEPVDGAVGAGGVEWASSARPTPGGAYTVAADVSDSGRSTHLTTVLQVAEQPASAKIHFGILPGASQTVGVNAPVVIRFDHPVTEKAAVENALHVATTTPLVGSWHWVSKSEVHFRPETAWPAHSKVRVTADFDGLQMSDTRYGTRNSTVNFSIGDAHVTTVNDKTHTFVVTVNGKTKYSWTTSLGKPLYETRTGNYIVLEKDPLREMTSCQAKITCNKSDPQYYDLMVHWDSRLSWSGTFIHAAPWDSHLGFADVSHGCIHLTTANAKTYYDMALYGDIVHVLHTSRPITDLLASGDPGTADWNLTWSRYVAGSALGQSITTDSLTAVATPVPSDSGPAPTPTDSVATTSAASTAGA
jgi:lipoprotein-anchoring transpeptidase ErfK/SrfK